MHCIKTHRQKAWDDRVAPSVCLFIYGNKMYLSSNRELEALFRAADPTGNGHVSLDEGAQILGKEFPAMKPELLQTITQRYGYCPIIREMKVRGSITVYFGKNGECSLEI